LGLHVVEFGEDICERDTDGCVGDDELGVDAGLGAVGCCDPGVAADGVYEPDVFDAHTGVVGDALLHPVDAVFGRENFDADERGGVDDVCYRVGAAEDADVRHTIAAWSNLDSHFSACNYVPGMTVGMKDGSEDELQKTVWTFSHVSLLKLAVDVVAVGLVGGIEVLAYRDESERSHGDSIAQNGNDWWRK